MEERDNLDSGHIKILIRAYNGCLNKTAPAQKIQPSSPSLLKRYEERDL